MMYKEDSMLSLDKSTSNRVSSYSFKPNQDYSGKISNLISCKSLVYWSMIRYDLPPSQHKTHNAM